MSRAERQYVRVYHEDLQRDYPAVYADDAALAAWLRLLVIADKMWPMPGDLPRSVKSRALAVLVDAGLVEIGPPNAFRIRGHQAERLKRQESARNAAASRWSGPSGNAAGRADAVREDMRPHSERNADGNAESMPRPRPRPRPREIPPPPTEWGRRKEGTNPRRTGEAPRQTGNNPRATGGSPRQEREAEKRGPTRLGDIIRTASELAADPGWLVKPSTEGDA